MEFFSRAGACPRFIRGTSHVRDDVRQAPHLVVWAVLAGCMWAVANTLTIYAIRNVGLSIAFPLWNTNSLLGIFWGFLLFNELHLRRMEALARRSRRRRVMFGGATLLAIASSHQAAPGKAAFGIAAALGAGILWGTMYIPYRKAYLTGMNPLSFITFFTVGELATMTVARHRLSRRNPALARIGQRPRRAFLADARRIRLGHRRLVSAIRHEICRHQPRHSALQHQSTLGIAVGHSGFSRTARRRPYDLLRRSREDRADGTWRGRDRTVVGNRTASIPPGAAPPTAKASATASKTNTCGLEWKARTFGKSHSRTVLDWLLIAGTTALFAVLAIDGAAADDRNQHASGDCTRCRDAGDAVHRRYGAVARHAVPVTVDRLARLKFLFPGSCARASCKLQIQNQLTRSEQRRLSCNGSSLLFVSRY